MSKINFPLTITLLKKVPTRKASVSKKEEINNQMHKVEAEFYAGEKITSENAMLTLSRLVGNLAHIEELKGDSANLGVAIDNIRTVVDSPQLNEIVENINSKLSNLSYLHRTRISTLSEFLKNWQRYETITSTIQNLYFIT